LGELKCAGVVIEYVILWLCL